MPCGFTGEGFEIGMLQKSWWAPSMVGAIRKQKHYMYKTPGRKIGVGSNKSADVIFFFSPASTFSTVKEILL